MNHNQQKLVSIGLALVAACSGCAGQAKQRYAQAAPVAQSASEQQAGRESPALTNAAVEEENVKKALESFFHAVDVRNWKAVEDIIAKDFEYYGDDSVVLTRDEFINAMKDDGMKIDKLELKNVKVSLSPDGQMAWVKYSAQLESSMRGEPYNMQSVETVAFRKEGGAWRMTHNHASVKKLVVEPATPKKSNGA